MSASKDKGTRAETWAVREAQAWGLYARRNDLGQGHGDLEIYPAPTTRNAVTELGKALDLGRTAVVVQVKHADDNHYSRNRPPLAWLNQAHTQAEKAGAALGVLLVKPDGIAYRNVPDWHAWLTLHDLMTLYDATYVGERSLDAPVRVPFGSILALLGGTAP